MAVSTNKYVGLVASLLTVFSLIYTLITASQLGVPSANASPLSFTTGLIFAPLGLIGFILFLVAMYGFSKDYHDDAIFNYVLYGFIASIVAAGLVIAVGFIFLFPNLASTLLLNTPPGSNSAQFMQNFIEAFLPLYIVGSFISLIPASLNMLAFKKLSDKSEVRLFKTVGQLGVAAAAVAIITWFIGAALYYSGTITIYNALTFSVTSSIVSLIAWVLAAKAYYSMNMGSTQVQVGQPAQLPNTSTAQIKYCPKCGTANSQDAEFCIRCGAKQLQ